MTEGTKNSTFMSKLDDLLNEYSERRKLEGNDGDICVESPSGVQSGEVRCRFKENCYASKNKMGDCPCGLLSE